MGSRIFGNRPDCAYYLVIGLCGAALLTAFGGIFTYMGYWPQTHNHLQHAPNPHYYSYKASDLSIDVYSVLGPLCIILGIGIAITVGILALKYDCEYEPEEPKVAIMRLASEISLNFSSAQGESKYELITTHPTTAPPSQSPFLSTSPLPNADPTISENPNTHRVSIQSSNPRPILPSTQKPVSG